MNPTERLIHHVTGAIERGEAVAVVEQRAPRGAKTYIQRLGNGYRETVDEFDSRKEARAMLAEYQMADPTAHHYLSSRPCANWRTQ
jgi:hypothetical protein